MVKPARKMTQADPVRGQLEKLSRALRSEHNRASGDVHLLSKDRRLVDALYGVLGLLSRAETETFNMLAGKVERDDAARALNRLRMDLELEMSDRWTRGLYRPAEGIARILNHVLMAEDRVGGSP